MKTIDARGLSCPQPVILAAKGLDAGEFPFTIIVDNPASTANISRLLKKKDVSLDISEKDGDTYLKVDKK